MFQFAFNFGALQWGKGSQKHVSSKIQIFKNVSKFTLLLTTTANSNTMMERTFLCTLLILVLSPA